MRNQRVAVNGIDAQTFAQRGVVLQSTVNARLKRGVIGQVGDTDGATSDLVLVTRTDAAPGGANLSAFRRGLFTGAVQFTVERQDQRRVFGNHQGFGIDFNALLGDRFNLAQQVPRVQNHTIADDRQLATAHHARGQRVQLIDLTIDDQRVARIVPALKARDHVGTFGQPVHDLAFSFVAPLSAYNHDIGHLFILSDLNPRPYSGLRVRAKPIFRHRTGPRPPFRVFPWDNEGLKRELSALAVCCFTR